MNHLAVLQRSPSRRWWLLLVLPAFVAGCDSTLPSAKLRSEVRLPIPNATQHDQSSDRLSRIDRGVSFQITPRTLIQIAFDRQPDIKSSYQRFKSEEARYDFFVVSRDSLTPRLTSTNSYSEDRVDETVARHRSHSIEFGIEKRFFDTTEMDVAIGFRANAEDEAIGYRPYLAAQLRYPLWVSRRKLARTSEEIFRRNELNDAQLGYIQLVRRSLRGSLFDFYDVMNLRRRLVHWAAWEQDLREVLQRIDAIVGRDVSADRERVEAELTSISAGTRETQGRLDVDIERFKAACGLPFHAKLEMIDEPFNPFEGFSHEQLFRMSIETDPEIATLRNEQKNAEVQLDLARRGRWDVTLLAEGQSSLEGAGEEEGISDWSATVGVEVNVIDARVTESLIRQAEARIERFQQAIIAREDDIFVDTFEPIIRIETLTESRDELVANRPRYESDYRMGVEQYLAGTLNIDDLLKRRESLYDQDEQISRYTFLNGANVAELCAATGKFFELLEKGSEGSAATAP